jgi:hypothetical protein
LGLLIIQKTTRAKVEFHQRYWTNIPQAKNEFILGLLKPNLDNQMTSKWVFQDHVSAPH